MEADIYEDVRAFSLPKLFLMPSEAFCWKWQ